MNCLDAFILGLVQGLAEFLPISSSGHLEIFSNILGLNLSGADALDFDAALHVATALATITVLRREFFPLCKSFFTLRNDDNTRYVWKILLSCIPVAIVGFFFKDFVEQFFGDGLRVVGICLCVTALLLTFAWLFRTHDLQRNGGLTFTDGRRPRNITWVDAFVIGLAQAVAVLPGLSRSGTTIATGILLGDKREQVARFSFLMVIIPILGEAMLDVKGMLDGSATVSQAVGALPLAIGFVTSFIVGCIACKWMLELVKKGQLVWFALYCVAMGVLCIVW